MLTSRLRSCAVALAVAVAGMALAPAARAATPSPPYELDETMGDAGFARVAPSGNTYLEDMVVLPDGRIVVVGETAGVPLVMRLLPGGHPDPRFGNAGRGAWSGPANSAATAVAADPSGGVVVGVRTLSTQLSLTRLTAGGAVDTGFGSGMVPVPDSTTAFAVDGSGRILLGGPGTGGAGQIWLMRLTVAGAPDPSFGSAGSVTLTVPSSFGMAAKSVPNRIVSAPSGRFLVAGYINADRPGGQPFVARVLDTGGVDPGFGNGGFTVGGMSHPSPDYQASISDISVLPDGSAVAVGSTSRAPNAAAEESGTFVARYDAAGRLDPGFGLAAGSFRPGPYPGGGRAIGFSGPVLNIAHVLAPDGRGGWLVPVSVRDTFHNPGLGLVRFGESGRPDDFFDDDGVLVVEPSKDTYEIGAMIGAAPGNAVILATTAQPPPNSDPASLLRGSIVVSRVQPAPHRNGYWMLGEDGSLWAFGGAPMKGLPGPGYKWVDVEPTPTGAGYWSLASNGTVFSFGNAKKLAGVWPPLDGEEKASSLSATPSGKGYWIFTTSGRVFPFGDAASFGDMSKVKLNGPVLDSVATPTGRGYFMVASDGGIFAFGDAVFAGSMGGRKLNAPVQSLVPDGDGAGYWLVASDGGVFAFDAPFRGSMGGHRLNGPVTGMVRFGNGYLMVGTDGGIFNFSDKEFFGSLGGTKLKTTITAVAAIDT